MSKIHVTKKYKNPCYILDAGGAQPHRPNFRRPYLDSETPQGEGKNTWGGYNSVRIWVGY